MEASPEGFRLTPDKSGRVRGELLLTNDGLRPVQVAVGVESLDASTAWLTLSKTNFTLPPGARRRIRFAGSMPPSRGEWLGRIVAKGREPQGDSWFELVLVRPIEVSVPSREKRDARLVGVSVRREGTDLAVDGSLENAGNVHLRPRLILEVEGREGTSVRPRDVLPEVVMPGQRMPFHFLFPAGGDRELRGVVSAFYPAAGGRIDVVRSTFSAGGPEGGR
jgi:hypothetical protein